MPRTISNASLWAILIAASFLFIPALLFTKEIDDLFEVLNLLIFAMALGTAVAIHPAAWDSMKMPIHRLKAPQIWAVALTLMCIFIAGVFAGQYWWRYTGKNSTISDSWQLAFTRWGLLVSIVMAYLAAGTERGEVPVSTYQRAGAIVAGTVLLAGLALTFGYA